MRSNKQQQGEQAPAAWSPCCRLWAIFAANSHLISARALRRHTPSIHFPGLSWVGSPQLNAEVAKRVKRAREDMTLRGLPFVGRDAVLRQRFTATPKTPAPRRNPSPRIAAKSTPERVHAIRRMLAFVREYRAAWHDWRNGNRAAVFPIGTDALRIHARVACAPAVPA